MIFELNMHFIADTDRDENSLRAKGTLISEPRFSTPLRDAFFPREKGKTAFFKETPSTKTVFPFSRGKNRISQGVGNRGSLISVPLALRVILKLILRSRCRHSCSLQF